MPNTKFSSPKELQEATFKSQNEAAVNSESAKQKTELIRYKQECRKRALDFAFQQYSFQLAAFQRSEAYAKNELFTFDIKKKADEYYEWLTKELN